MPIKTMTPTKEQINELRDLFIQKYENDPPKEPFHHVDIDRVRNEDLWCTRFLEMYDLDMKLSFDKLWETCIWRKEFGANDLSEKNVRMDYLKDGVVFTRNKDLDGCPLLIFKTKLHTKGTKDMDEVIRVVVYWIERIHRETHMEKITIIFDMAGTGLASMDLDFVKRIIETFKMYYPNALNYILIFEMAWILNAAFKVIKGILPAKAIEILKTITKKDINTYIDNSNCLSDWGGTDNYQYSFVPEKIVQKSMVTAETETNGTVQVTTVNHNVITQDKKVHFADNKSYAVPTPMNDFKEIQPTPLDCNMLQIVPNEAIQFPQSNEASETSIEITCIGEKPVTYKIQTTSPDKFRVRPRCGILQPKENACISIVLKQDNKLSEGSKDKFLIMGMALPDCHTNLTPQQLSDMWRNKQISSPDVEQHRLCCVYYIASAAGSAASTNINASVSKTKDLSKHAEQLEKQLKRTQLLQCITLFFLLILSGAVIYLLKLQMDGSSDGSCPNYLHNYQQKPCYK